MHYYRANKQVDAHCLFSPTSADAAGITGAQTGEEDNREQGVREKLTSMVWKKTPLTQKWVNGQISNFQVCI